VRLRSLTRIVAGSLVCIAGGALALGGPARAASGDDQQLTIVGPTSSAVTIAATGTFSGLKLTVGQTKNLVNQAISLTWTGGSPTIPDSARFGVNYLQVMQCWGSSASGPTPDQCEFGARAAQDDRGGDYTASRQLNSGSIVDPLESTALTGSTKTEYAPFSPVTKEPTSVGNTNEFFDGGTTNELPYVRTRSDGTGEALFETLTDRESPGLGCGKTAPSGLRRCWLVVVPRDDHEVDGTARSGQGGGPTEVLTTSPLSTSNWLHRIVVPLDFLPIGDVCPLGAQERRTIGSELVTEAVTKWQPTLCAGKTTVYGFAQVGSAVGTRQLASATPGLVFLTEKASLPRRVVYAPVAVSTLGIGVMIETQTAPLAPAALRANDGRPITSMNLTQRVVAKMLTQSYQTAIPDGGRYLAANPRDLTRDPDFLKDNAVFKDLRFDRVPDMMVPLGSSTANKQLWDWITSDKDARDFLAGYPDPSGMRVNPFYQGFKAPTDNFPRVDPYCRQFAAPVTPFAPQSPLCTLDGFPYSSDLHEATRAAGRGDRLAKTQWNLATIGGDTPPGYKKAPVQIPGKRALVAFSDSSTSARFGLPMAHLRNASGVFVAPTATSIAAGVGAMTTDRETGVAQLSPTTTGAAIYPLTTVTYAATVPSLLGLTEAKDLATFVRYAAGPGQVPGTSPGQLPEGYIPLNAQQRAQALAAASLIEQRVGAADPTPAPTVTIGPPGSPFSGLATPGSAPPPSASSNPSAPPGSVPPSAKGAKSSALRLTSPASQATPGLPVGLLRYVLVAALLLGGLGLISAPAVPWVARRFARRSG
jgi:hypothetical protein